MRLYVYAGPMPRNDGPAVMTHLALQRIPDIESYWFQCHGDPAMFGRADRHLAIDWGEDDTPFHEFVEPRPLTYWMSDTNVSEAKKRFRYDKARRADTVFCAIWSDPEALRKEGITARWLPYAAEPLIWYPRVDIKEERDVVFIGHHGNYPARAEWLEEMIQSFPSFHVQGGVFYEACAEMMATGRVVLNHIQGDGINMRVVEALMNGQCLLTPKTSDLPYLGLKDGVHLMTYTTLQEAKDKCADALRRPNLRRNMGQEGRRWALGGHTYLHRAYALLDQEVPMDIAQQLQVMPNMKERTLPDSIPVKAVKA